MIVFRPFILPLWVAMLSLSVNWYAFPHSIIFLHFLLPITIDIHGTLARLFMIFIAFIFIDSSACHGLPCRSRDTYAGRWLPTGHSCHLRYTMPPPPSFLAALARITSRLITSYFPLPPRSLYFPAYFAFYLPYWLYFDIEIGHYSRHADGHFTWFDA